MKPSTKKALIAVSLIPLIPHIILLLILAITAAYSWTFTGDTIWLAFNWSPLPINQLGEFVGYTTMWACVTAGMIVTFVNPVTNKIE